MHLFRLARNPTQWLRVALLAFVLGFGLNSIAHASHAHDGSTAPTHQLSCGYCLHLGTLADAPRHSHAVPFQSQAQDLRACIAPAIRSCAPELVAQPRAPPVS